ncbi:MAG: type II secretion system F family protein [Candidatus Palauibacterales bacterium]|nr:type II secretion system F family protein [Candidatus Palauibacterales bacterium]MDP2530581.1 type II secretion system F family protein [Candidatus Palauibacterales bacterium]MDP2583620.1 type II secretion system F family protein [Candidatus Palauibacterales bacterium]
MATWNYSARTVAGEIHRDSVELPSRDDVVSYLRKQKLIPITIREKPKEISFTFGSGVKTRDLVLFTRQFATMVNAGLPLVQALDILQQQTENKVLKKTIQEILYDVESGHTLADALREHEAIFSGLYVNMVEAGEAGGILDTILLRLATFLEKNDALARKVKGAMIYPAVVMVVAIAAIAILLLFVIPTFQTMFASFNATLPLPTRIVIAMSQALQHYGIFVLAGLILAGFAFQRWVKTPGGRLIFDRSLLRIPILGTLARKAAVARFTRTLSTLLSSGVSILEGLEITAKTSGNRVIHDAVMTSRASIAGGRSIAEPLKETDVFPPMVTQMIHVGEETGDLDGMLSKVADFYDDEVDVAVESLLKALEPAMIVVLGTIVGGMIVAMYLPIFSLVNAIH